MTPAIAHNQQQIFLRLWRSLQPCVRTDRALPARIQAALRRRAFGARDRRLYRELLYTAIRYLPWIEEIAARSEAKALQAAVWLAADAPATRGFREAVVADWPPLPPTISARAHHLGVAPDLLPGWFRRHCPEVFQSPNLEALQTRAPLWIRLQTDDPATVFSEFSARRWAWRRSEACPDACEILTDVDLTASAAYRGGRFEVQDLGSQMILASAEIERGGRWLDACAGAGGKTLQLARLLGPAGSVDAFDVRPAALEELHRRARRGGFTTVHLLDRLPSAGDYDGVLVDAPCSGSGTWRRAPHLKWCTAAADVAAYARHQQDLLAGFSHQLHPGGMLVYATCSLSRHENQEAARAFLAVHPAFVPLAPARTFDCVAGDPGLTILPARHNTDGFFVAAFRRAR
ncbi:MAG TPA: RsmB/NOP family class I SAM-dependent RNA methyltransferase [Opitutaceae bacterium]|nr:RsmB/NOP family class I SAM-dependent RNA methyltransferase [Opitutaceae bacterium]